MQNDLDRICHRCSTACGGLTYIIPHESTSLSMADNVENDLQETRTNSVYLCLDCVQLASPSEPAGENERKVFPYNIDGACEKDQIMEAAEKLHPLLKQKEVFCIYLPEGPTLEPGKGSNCKQGLRLRRQKQYDVIKIHEELGKINSGHNCQHIDLNNDELGLRILSPVLFEGYRESYKKQGLEWKNRMDHVKDLEVEHISESECEDEPKSGMTKRVLEEIRATCYCDKTLFHEKMIRCSSASCLYVWLHLRCAGLTEIPQDCEDYLCPRCTELAAERLESSFEDGPIHRSSSVGCSEGYEASISGNEQSSGDEELAQDGAENGQYVSRASGWVAVNN